MMHVIYWCTYCKPLTCNKLSIGICLWRTTRPDSKCFENFLTVRHTFTQALCHSYQKGIHKGDKVGYHPPLPEFRGTLLPQLGNRGYMILLLIFVMLLNCPPTMHFHTHSCPPKSQSARAFLHMLIATCAQKTLLFI